MWMEEVSQRRVSGLEHVRECARIAGIYEYTLLVFVPVLVSVTRCLTRIMSIMSQMSLL